MPMISLTYISVSTLAEVDVDHEVDRIVATARAFNPTVDITGALLFDGTHFAQILEGEEMAVDALMKALLRDVRHRDLRVVDRGRIRARSFRDWAMAYAGTSIYVSGFVAAVLDAPTPADREIAVRALTALMAGFVRD